MLVPPKGRASNDYTTTTTTTTTEHINIDRITLLLLNLLLLLLLLRNIQGENPQSASFPSSLAC